MKETSKYLGINLFCYNKDNYEQVIEKILIIHERKAVLSFNKDLDLTQEFPRCTAVKVNINLALSTELGYTIDYETSIPEIYETLGLEIPKHRLKEKLCQHLKIPYFFSTNSSKKESKQIVARAQNETLYFNSISETSKFFCTSTNTIVKAIEMGYNFPFWFKRYKLEFV